MTDLTARTKGAGDELAVGHHATTDASANRDEHEAAGALCGALPQLAERRRVGVVHEGEVGVDKGALDGILQALGVELDVGEHAHLALVVDGAGHVQANGDDILGGGAVLGEQALETLGDHGKRGLAHDLASRDLGDGLERTLRREHADLDARTANVDAQNLIHVMSLLEDPIATVVMYAAKRLPRPESAYPLGSLTQLEKAGCSQTYAFR